MPGAITSLDEVWAKTDPHKVTDLADDVEIVLCKSGTDIVRANYWRFARVLGPGGDTAFWQSGFTNVPADTLSTVLTEMGFEVIEGDTVL
ncbi:MAG: hypothetical protein ACI8S6_003398 [Myxococcota bacterium]